MPPVALFPKKNLAPVEAVVPCSEYSAADYNRNIAGMKNYERPGTVVHWDSEQLARCRWHRTRIAQHKVMNQEASPYGEPVG